MDKYPFYILLHPFDGYNELKCNKKWSVKVSVAILVLWFAVRIFKRQYMAFPFNPNHPDDLNIFLVLSTTIGIFILWVISNWAICTLMDGEGTPKEIWVSSAYALLPYIIITAFATIISRFMTLEIAIFLHYLQNLGVLWSVLLMFSAMHTIHQYKINVTLITMGLTIVGMLIVTFLGSLIFSLFQQVFIFIYTIYNEIALRL